MSRIAYVNGRYLPWRDAGVSIEDRGYQFSDGVYEACEVRDGRIVDWPRHAARLSRSLSELRIREPMPMVSLYVVLREVIRRNRVSYGIVYLQVTRGVARRDHAFPAGDVAPSLVVNARKLNFERNQQTAAKGIAVITVPENRWERVDIKAVSLLPNVLARQAARERGAYEAWFVDRDGFVTEGAASNAWIVTADGRIVTRANGPGILAGITGQVLRDVIAALQLRLEERPFSLAEAYAAREAFVTASSQIVMPVVAIDGQPVADGMPGPVALRLRDEFHRFSHFS
ncbi:MAG: D-amino-acid transaminase [Xanthobacteraceae bacterium]|nr:MAG: D-amino-acid transaminase [Xanthobacteraceae bacterium]